MSADYKTSGFGHFCKSATHNLIERGGIAALWESDQRERGNWAAAHGVNITERICGGNLSEEIWIVNNWREKIGGLNESEIRRDAIDAGVVAGFKSAQNIWVGLAGKAAHDRV